MSKQDRTYPRTAADLERKYNFGRNFSEILGVAKDAQTHAYNAEASVKEWSQRIVGIEGDFAEITAEQDKITLRVQDVEGECSEIKQDVDKISLRVTGVEGSYSEIIQTQESITAKVGDLEGDYSKLTQTVDGISAEVVSLDGEFSKMEQTVDGISTNVADLSGKYSTIEQTVDKIDLSVYAKTTELANYATNDGVDGKLESYSTKTEVENKISMAIDGIDLSVYETTQSIDNKLSEYATTEYVSGNLALTIKTDPSGMRYSELSANVEKIVFNAGDIEIDADNFSLTADGKATAKEGNFDNCNINYCNINYGSLGEFSIVDNGLECVVGKGSATDIDGWKYETITSLRLLSGRIETSWRKNRYDYDDIGLANPILESEVATTLSAGYFCFKTSTSTKRFTVMYIKKGYTTYEIVLDTNTNTLEVVENGISEI